MQCVDRGFAVTSPDRICGSLQERHSIALFCSELHDPDELGQAGKTRHGRQGNAGPGPVRI